MKKVIALVMCVAMIACVAVTANAATKATFTIDTVEYANVGDVVTINMTANEADTMIGAAGFKITWDTAVLELVANEDEEYFAFGKGAGAGASCMGNEANGEIQIATDKGMKRNDAPVVTMLFKVLQEIEGTSVISAETTMNFKHNEDDTITYDVSVIAGGVKAKAEVIPEPPVSTESTPSKEESKVDEVKPVVSGTDANHAPMGEASAIAVAAGLCAVMAAGFVFAKKAR